MRKFQTGLLTLNLKQKMNDATEKKINQDPSSNQIILSSQTLLA